MISSLEPEGERHPPESQRGELISQQSQRREWSTPKGWRVGVTLSTKQGGSNVFCKKWEAMYTMGGQCTPWSMGGGVMSSVEQGSGETSSAEAAGRHLGHPQWREKIRVMFSVEEGGGAVSEMELGGIAMSEVEQGALLCGLHSCKISVRSARPGQHTGYWPQQTPWGSQAPSGSSGIARFGPAGTKKNLLHPWSSLAFCHDNEVKADADFYF